MARTDFLGRLEITPALNAYEIARLAAMSRDHAPGSSELCLSWEASSRGRALVPVGVEACCDPVASLRFLIRNYLKPCAFFSRSCLPAFEGFTFDHRLDGAVVGCRRDTRELILVTVKGNRVSRRVLSRDGATPRDGEAVLAEPAGDRPYAERRRPPVPSHDAGAVVVDLASRRASGRLSPDSA